MGGRELEEGIDQHALRDGLDHADADLARELGAGLHDLLPRTREIAENR